MWKVIHLYSTIVVVLVECAQSVLETKAMMFGAFPVHVQILLHEYDYVLLSSISSLFVGSANHFLSKVFTDVHLEYISVLCTEDHRRK